MQRFCASLLLFLLLSAPALAQAPPPIPPIPDAPRTITYNITSSTAQVSVPFAVFGDCSDIQVQINGLTVPLPTSVWNCASASGFALNTLPLPITDMVVNLTPPLTSATLVITGAWHPRNLSVPTAPGINRREYEQAVSTLVAAQRELYAGYQFNGLLPIFAAPPPIGATTPNTGAFTSLSSSGTISGTGFSNYLLTPPPIGATTPSTGAFTTLSASGAVSGTGFSSYFASPPALGSTSPSSAAVTTLSASGAVSGAGFSNYLLSPPPIGATTPSTGAFTTLSASGTVSGAGFSPLFASPPPVGSTAANTGAFTTLAASGAVSGTGFSNYLASPPPIGSTTPNSGAHTTLSASGAVSGAGFTSFMASPPPIGSTTPNTGNFSDRMRTLQSFGVVGDGVTDDTANLSTALNSGSPLYCQGTMKVTSLITVAAKDVGMFAAKSSSCTINLTTATSSIYFNEGPTNKITIQNLTIVPKVAITSTGSPNAAALDIEYSTGGTNNGPVTSVNLKNIFIIPDAAGHYTTSGIYLYNTNVTELDNIYEGGDSGTYRSTTNGVVYDTNNTGTVFTSHHLFFTDVANGVLVPVHATHGPQGIRIYDLDCVYCNVGVNATGGSDGLSDQLVVQGAEGAVQTAGLSINNFNHVSVSDNYWFLINSNLTSPPTPANPSCYILNWGIAIPTNGASNALLPGNTCDGAQMTTFTGSRVGAYLIGVSNTNMSSTVGPQTLTNLDVGVQISANTAGWTIHKQATKNVTLEVSNGGTAGANTLVPPLAVTDGSAQAAGLVGEVKRSSIAVGSEITLTNGVAANVTSVSLTPGDWDCRGGVGFDTAANTNVTLLSGGVSSTSASVPALGTGGFWSQNVPAGIASAAVMAQGFPVAPQQVNISSTASEYLVAESNFTVSTQKAYGTIECRRMR
jgi:hypothetical protein